MENLNKTGIWIDDEDVKAVIKIARQVVEPHLKSQFKDKLMSREIAINRQQVLVLAEDILLRLNSAGVSAAELMEWIDNKEEIRTGVVRAIIQSK